MAAAPAPGPAAPAPAASFKLQVNKQFYPLPALLATAQAFSNAAFVSVNEGERYYEVSLSPKLAGLERKKLEGEFLNYLLSVAKTKNW
jgi:hypothetical protein